MSNRKRIMIGVPMHKGDVSQATMHSVVQASSDLHEVNFQLLGLSLLAKNFNMLWISAYLKGYDYFMLHHSDIGVIGNLSGKAEGSWIDLLVHRVQELEAAALSVVVPIKSEAGFTSTALEMESINPFSLRRITMTELERLPVDFINRADVCELFGVSESVAGALLVNTGLMIMDLKKDLWFDLKWPGFTIEDSIEWNTKGVPESYTIPEDWGFSRWAHAHDVPVYATRELICGHVGMKVYQNQGSWGEFQEDSSYTKSIEDYRNS